MNVIIEHKLIILILLRAKNTVMDSPITEDMNSGEADEEYC